MLLFSAQINTEVTRKSLVNEHMSIGCVWDWIQLLMLNLQHWHCRECCLLLLHDCICHAWHAAL